MKRKPLLRTAALLAALAIVLAACGSSSKSKSGGGGVTTATTTNGPVPTGGTLTVGAEQEPDCFDWIGSCGGSSWGFWMAQVQTVPTAFVPVGTGGNLTLQPGPVLAGEPVLKTDPVETITYNIAPAAVWSDKVAITCADFKYTWQQEKIDSDIYDRTGYDIIDNVACPQGENGKQAVVTFAKGDTFASWQQLFAGSVGIYPSHLLKGQERDTLLKNGYTWSGGPWFAKWNKGDSIVLTPNPNYWVAADKPKLDKVVFKFLPDTAAEFQAYKSGQVQAIYPQPQIDVVDAIANGLADSNTVYNSQTASDEALWLNNEKPPFNEQAVRQALGYAIDRDSLVNRLFGKLGVKTAVNSLNPYVVRDYSDQNAWSMYHLDLNKVSSLMTGAGWKKGADGIWAKGGQRASFTIQSTTGNKRRELTETVIQQQLKDAGFEMKIQNQKSGDLFGEILPKGNYQVGLFANVLTALTPGECNLFCTKNIPNASTKYSGNNWYRVSNPQLDTYLLTVDNNLDDSARKDAAKKADDLMAQLQVSLPLDPLPDICIWNKKVVGPIGDNAILGMFWNINKWGVQP